VRRGSRSDISVSQSTFSMRSPIANLGSAPRRRSRARSAHRTESQRLVELAPARTCAAQPGRTSARRRRRRSPAPCAGQSPCADTAPAPRMTAARHRRAAPSRLQPAPHRELDRRVLQPALADRDPQRHADQLPVGEHRRPAARRGRRGSRRCRPPAASSCSRSATLRGPHRTCGSRAADHHDVERRDRARPDDALARRGSARSPRRAAASRRCRSSPSRSACSCRPRRRRSRSSRSEYLVPR
jgi:hypothetical protein